MSNVLIDENIVQGWADTIREKHGIEDSMKPDVLLEKTKELSGEDFWRMYDGLTDYTYKFYFMKTLESVELFDTSQGESFANMFYECNALTEIPKYDLSSGTSTKYMFYRCKALTTIPEIDFSHVTTGSYTFQDCTGLTTLPTLDFSNATTISNICYNCPNLHTIEKIIVSPTTSVSNMFISCGSLQNITFEPLCIGNNIQFAHSSKLSDASIQSIIDGLVDLTDAESKTLTLNSAVKAKLTEEQIATITSKNWTLA